MSAFMMPAKTTAIIAEYLALAATSTGHSGTYEGIKTIEPPKRLLEYLKGSGCYDARHDEYMPEAIYNMMSNINLTALKERYHDVEDGYEAYERQPISILECDRRKWLANLYTVARCYHYQIAEGMVSKSDFYHYFGEWIDGMARVLAEFVVDEVRPKYSAEVDNGWKSWSEF